VTENGRLKGLTQSQRRQMTDLKNANETLNRKLENMKEDAASEHQKLEDECRQLRNENQSPTERVKETERKLTECKERAESLDRQNKELRVKAVESVVSHHDHTAQDGNPRNPGPSTAKVFIKWVHPRIPITLKNIGDHYISYQYSQDSYKEQDDYEIQMGFLEPTQTMQARLLAHTPYKFYLCLGPREITHFRRFTKEADFDLAQLFV